MVCIQDFEHYTTEAFSYEVWAPVDKYEDQLPLIVNGALTQRDKLYGYPQLISMGLRRILDRLFKITIGNFIRWGDVCCQVPLTGLSMTNIPPFMGVDPKDWDTEELFQNIAHSGKFRLIADRVYRAT